MSRIETMLLLLLLLLLLPSAALTANTLGRLVVEPPAVDSRQQIPPSSSNSTTKLMLSGSHVTLTKEDRVNLEGYSQLEELDLSGSQVTQIPAQYFAVVGKLRVLLLSANKISSLDAESFSGLDALTQLDLSHNLLSNINAQLFTRLSKIKVLNLQGNPWNCCCPLMNVSEGGNKTSARTDEAPRHTCVSLDNQAVVDFFNVTAECNQSATPETTTDEPATATTVVYQPLSSAHTAVKTGVTSLNTTAKDRPVEGGNSWKFTLCVAAFAAGTFLLILCAIKGPSWYKLYHNYRHRQLRDQEEEGEGWEGREEGPGGVATVFSDVRRQADRQLFTFDFHHGQTDDWEEEAEAEEEEEAEEGYYEDPYFKRVE